jgi:hypothetical protein
MMNPLCAAPFRQVTREILRCLLRAWYMLKYAERRWEGTKVASFNDNAPERTSTR